MLIFRHRKKIFLIALAIFCLVGVVIVRLRISKLSAPPSSGSEDVSVSVVRDPLTGMWIRNAKQNIQAYGVIIDEHVDAFPLSGIDRAFLVFEAQVESGTPRLLAFFSADTFISKIGPVRSARPYFIDWNNELDALFVHVGGSDEALAKIKTIGTHDLNEFWNGNVFWRDMNRFSPHNVYTSTDLLASYVKKRIEMGRFNTPVYGVWTFKDAEQNPQTEVTHIAVRFAGQTAVWVFDSMRKQYARLQNDEEEKTEEGAIVIADNVVVVATDITIQDNVGRRKIRTIGTGRAVVFQDGRKIDTTWEKKNVRDRLRFFDAQGKEVVFNAGVTWIEVIRDISQIITQ